LNSPGQVVLGILPSRITLGQSKSRIFKAAMTMNFLLVFYHGSRVRQGFACPTQADNPCQTGYLEKLIPS
jgi:hypothetical protein